MFYIKISKVHIDFLSIFLSIFLYFFLNFYTSSIEPQAVVQCVPEEKINGVWVHIMNLCFINHVNFDKSLPTLLDSGFLICKIKEILPQNREKLTS